MQKPTWEQSHVNASTGGEVLVQRQSGRYNAHLKKLLLKPITIAGHTLMVADPDFTNKDKRDMYEPLRREVARFFNGAALIIPHSDRSRRPLRLRHPREPGRQT